MPTPSPDPEVLFEKIAILSAKSESAASLKRHIELIQTLDADALTISMQRQLSFSVSEWDEITMVIKVGIEKRLEQRMQELRLLLDQ